MARKNSNTAVPQANQEQVPLSVTQPPNLPSKVRLEALSDGIFAVAMTLLVLDIRLPEMPSGANTSQVLAGLLHIWPKFIAFIISFSFLARAWHAHRTIYHFVDHVDYAFSYLTTSFLLVVCLLPFSTSMISEHPRTSIAAAVYAINLIVLPGIVYVMWRHAQASSLLDKKDGPDAAIWAIGRHRLVIGAMLPALPIAFFYSELAILWILCWHVYFDARPFFAKHAGPKEPQVDAP
jgi:uncharacterized membrane protein